MTWSRRFNFSANSCYDKELNFHNLSKLTLAFLYTWLIEGKLVMIASNNMNTRKRLKIHGKSFTKKIKVFDMFSERKLFYNFRKVM